MSDLSSLMQIAPYAGSYMAGQQNVADLSQKDAETQRLQQLIQGLQLKNQFDQQNNPLMIQHQGLVNQGLEAGLPGITADSSKKTSEAALKAGTLDTDIAAGNSKNQTDITADKVKQMRSGADLLYGAGQVAKLAQGAGPGASQLAVVQYFQQKGIPADHPAVKQAMSMTPDQMTQYADAIMKHTEQYSQVVDTENLRAGAQRDVAGIHAQSARDVEQMRIDAGKYTKADKYSLEARINAAPNAKAKAEILEAAYYTVKDREPDLAAQYLQRAMEARQRANEDAIAAAGGKQAGTPNVGAITNLPVNAPPMATAPVGGAAPTGPVNAGQAQKLPPGISSLADVRKLYPGKSDADLKAAIKSRYGVDLQ